ncbi:MAG: terpene cyclase/mutase family protein [Clostridiales bacterium]|nr:terpene cyclase/mutase family protein [Clostridiales bacterium]
MKNQTKTFVSFCLSALLLFSCIVPACASHTVSTDELAGLMQGIYNWKKASAETSSGKLLSSKLLSSAGSAAFDWYAFAVGRCGFEEDYASCLAVFKRTVQQRYAKSTRLNAQKATEWHRISLVTLALGGDPTDMGADAQEHPIDLIRDGTYDRGKTAPLDAQGINGCLWGLIALDSMRYAVPEGAADTRRGIIASILSCQLADGGFSLDGKTSDVDVTAMAVTALAPYYNSEETFSWKSKGDHQTLHGKAREALGRAIEFLSSAQQTDGDFSNWGQCNPESTAQVMVALCSLGIDPEHDSRFIKNENSVLDGLLKYRCEDGGFAHSLKNGEDRISNSMAGEQALTALCALYRYRAGLRSLYDCRAEMSPELKAQIAALDSQIESLPDDPSQAGRETVETLFQKYLDIPESERCYVRQYSVLSDAMQALSIPNTSRYLSECMDENTGGNGTVISILSLEGTPSGILFDEDDLAEYHALPEAMTTEHSTVVFRLYEKLRQAENAADYAEVLDGLALKKEQIEAIQAEIESINGEIAEKLYPFDRITEADRGTIEALVRRTQALSDYDRTQVLGLEDLLRSKAEFDSASRRIWIFVTAAILTLASIGLLCRRIKKRRAAAADRRMENENDDW